MSTNHTKDNTASKSADSTSASAAGKRGGSAAKCPACNAALDAINPTDQYCPYCGEKLQPAPPGHCSACNAGLNPETMADHFCPFCGAPQHWVLEALNATKSLDQITFVPRFPTSDPVSWAATMTFGPEEMAILTGLRGLTRLVWFGMRIGSYLGHGDGVSQNDFGPGEIRVRMGSTHKSVKPESVRRVVASRIAFSNDEIHLGKYSNHDHFKQCWLDYKSQSGTSFCELRVVGHTKWMIAPLTPQLILQSELSCGNCGEDLVLSPQERADLRFDCPSCRVTFASPGDVEVAPLKPLHPDDACFVRIGVRVNSDLRFRPLLPRARSRDILQEVDGLLGESFEQRVLYSVAGKHGALCVEEQEGSSDEWFVDAMFHRTSDADAFRADVHEATAKLLVKCDEIHVVAAGHSPSGIDRFSERLFTVEVYPAYYLSEKQLLERLREIAVRIR